MFKIFNKSGLGFGLRYKNNREGEDLEKLATRWRGQWHTIYCLLGYKGEKQFYLPGMGYLRTRTVDAMGRQKRGGWLQRCPLSYDQARCNHPPFAECYAIQAFSIAPDFDPQLMPKIQNQITMRKVCIVIQSFVSRRSNRDHPRTPSVHLHHCLRVVVHHANLSADWIRQSPKQTPRTDGLPYQRPWTDLNWSARLRCRLLSPLGPR